MRAYQFGVVIVLAVIASVVLTSIEIPILKHRQFQQFIREDGPKSHLRKQGTPTMGGIAIYAAIVMCTIIGTRPTRDTWIIILVGLAFGLIGFLDDFIKVTEKHNLGLRAWQKLVLQILAGVLFGVYIMKFTDMGSQVWVPFIDRNVDFGIWFVPFVAFVLVAMANSVNLTDGMDGLCGGVSAIFAFFFAIVANIFASYPSAFYLCAVCGACIGFLVYNKYPARVFMGDTGSMALGGGMTAAILMTKAELLIPFAGFVFVMEALSVIIQVVSFQTTGKRVFRMAPIHHHFEEGGMPEKRVVLMFWIAAAVCCAVAYGILKI
ncbi:phospho-N-acetylmuramoyl-pentapeptide-transferase [Hornefia porci]|uniref:Phospho-N-acetylmuramoyl-pentapeptide-transferase n=1 Tax=Hornefia porci TaxID=2652292 RepID=A0A1Q9JGG3_9FIRM|nr:phospho-N-acetylmuramoyl-pentapeptide-transferase [Hornefia porci]OLR55191.1 phospho-N-acetylmuramoyl-pentapeptide-transferase [Hornefia porci]